MQRAHYSVSSRTIDDAHRPRILRRASAASVQRTNGRPFVASRRWSKRNLVLCAALIAAIPGLGAPYWLLPGAPTLALRVDSAMRADGMTPPTPVAPDRSLSSGTAASGGSAPSAETWAGKVPESIASLPAAAGLDVTNGIDGSKPVVADNRSSKMLPSRLQQLRASGRAHAALRASAPRRHIVVQLSAYADQARARHEIASLHRSFRSVLNGTPLQTEKVQVHGKPVWRVVAGPVASRERGRRLCDAMHRAGQSCMVMLL